MYFVYWILSSFYQCRPGQLKGKRSSRMCLKALHKGEAVWQGSDTWIQGFPGGSDGKESAHSAEDLGSVPGLGRSPGGGPSNPLQYSCLENPHKQRSLVGYSPWGLKESRLSNKPSTWIQDPDWALLFPCNLENFFYVLCLVTHSCPTFCNPMDCSPPGSCVNGDCPGKNTGVGCRALLQGNFPTHGSNPGLLHCKQILYHLSHQESLYLYYFIYMWTQFLHP